MKGTFSISTLLVYAGIIMLCMSSGFVYADEVEDAVNDAMEYYRNGDYTNAAGNLEYAAQLIRQKKGGRLESVLPEPLSGWSAEDTTSQAAATAMFGGGVTAGRTFTRSESEVTVMVITDSPMLQGMMMLFANPAYAAAEGGKLERIGGRKAIVRYSDADHEGDIQIIVADRFLVTIAGSEVTGKELKAYAEAVDYKTLSTL